MADFTKITSYLEARDNLKTGEVLCGQLYTDTLIFIEQKSGHSIVHVMHMVGRSYQYRNDIYSFRTIYDGYIQSGVKFFFCKGVNLRSRKIRLYDKFNEFLKESNT